MGNPAHENDLYLLSLTGSGVAIEKKIPQQQALQIIQMIIANNAPAMPANSSVNSSTTISETIGDFIRRVEARQKHEQILAIAHYMKHSQSIDEFTRDDIRARFKPAGLPMPANIHRDFATTVKEQWIAEDPHQSGYFFITATGEAAVTRGYSRKPKANSQHKLKKDQPVSLKRNKPTSGRSNAQIDKSLDLNGADGKPSLNEFFQKHMTNIDAERNVVFAHYLSEIRNISPVTQDHIITCYHHLGLSLPVSMTSSLKNSNATSRGAYLMSSNPWDVKLSIPGLNLINKLKNKTGGV